MQNTEEKTEQPVSCKPWFCVLWSGAEVGLVWWAVTTEATGPGNVVKLFAVWNAIGGFVLIAASIADEKKDRRPKWLRRLLNVADAILALTLAWWGWWWCALAFSWGGLMTAGYRDRKGKTPNDQAQRRPDNAAPSATKGNKYE